MGNEYGRVSDHRCSVMGAVSFEGILFLRDLYPSSSPFVGKRPSNRMKRESEHEERFDKTL